MNPFFIKILILASIVIASFSCVKKKKFATTPEIEYKDFLLVDDQSAYLQVKFTDGDGNIFAKDGDTTKNFYYTYYYKDTVTQKYIAYYSDIFQDTLRVGYIVKTPTDVTFKGTPISGDISIKLQQYRHAKKIKNIKYTMYLIDQDGNKSNVITSPEISVP